MQELEDRLDAFIRGDIEYAAVLECLERVLRDCSADAVRIAAALSAARERGLAARHHTSLTQRMRGRGGAAARADAGPPSPAEAPTRLAEPTDGAPTTAGAAAEDEAPTVYAAADLAAAEDAAAGPAEAPTRFDPSGRAPAGGVPLDMVAPASQPAPADGGFAPGTLLRNRFELVEKLGEGGMGAVWKGRDRLKVQARDRNPYVAIKLLQGDFKEHPEAFIALQRETAKQQRLAHPNITTVYDFDRDADSDTVFMTMEALEGQALDHYVRSLPEGGLDFAEAMPVIEQLAAGLAFAHGNGLVHSDLKPGNAFLTKDGKVKLLDFGIARASKTHGDADGEKTLFDPGELGAITPAYATVEMFDGEPPDPRDDIYALGIMAYELLSGRHPYRRLTAPRARSMGLAPDPIDKLGRRENAALARALAFDRAERTPSVEEFLADLRPRERRSSRLAIAVTILVVVLAVPAYRTVVEQVQRREAQAVVETLTGGGLAGLAAGVEALQALESPAQRQAVLADPRVSESFVALVTGGDDGQMDAVLDLVAPLDPAWQQDLRDDDRVREFVVGRYRRRIDESFDPPLDRLDYAAATRTLARLEALYPNSAAVLGVRTDLEGRLDAEVLALEERYQQALDAGRILPGDGVTPVAATLARLRALEPGHPLLGGEALAARLATLADEAVAAGDHARAAALMTEGAALLPDAALIADARARLEPQIRRLGDAEHLAAARARLRAERAGVGSLEDFGRVREAMLTVARIDPSDAVLRDLAWQLRGEVESGVAGAVQSGDWPGAEAMLFEAAGLLSLADVGALRAHLSTAERAAGIESPPLPGRLEHMRERAAAVNALLREPTLTAAWESAFAVPFKEFVALAAPGDRGVETVRGALALLYRDRAAARLDAGEPEMAVALVARGLAVQPGSPELEAVDTRARAAIDAARARADELARAAESQAMQAALLEHAAAGEPDAAAKLLEALRSRPGAAAGFVTAEGPRAVADAYRRAAARRYGAGDVAAAAELAERGLAIDRAAPRLADDAARYRERLALTRLSAKVSAAMEAGRLGAARHALGEAPALASAPDVARLTARLGELEARAADAYRDYARRVRDGDLADEVQRAAAFAAVHASWSDNPEFVEIEYVERRPGICEAALAGRGADGGECHDLVAGGRPGIALVVVPPGDGVGRPFAIGKREVSIAEFNLFCETSGECPVRAAPDPKLPVTGLASRDAEAYARWLSAQASSSEGSPVVYRLPSEAEWRHAAGGGGRLAEKAINCRPQGPVKLTAGMLRSSGGTLSLGVPTGRSLVGAGFGEENGFGLVNAVGNAQEWVSSAHGLQARGGAFRDKASECGPDLARAHSGAPDPVTGFRLVREMP